MTRSPRFPWAVGVAVAFGLFLATLIARRCKFEPPEQAEIVHTAVAPEEVTGSLLRDQPAHQEGSSVDGDERRWKSYLSTTLADYKRNVNEPQHEVSGRFANETFLKQRELRLLALGYPQAIRGEILRLAKDETADLLERFAAFYALGVLAHAGDSEAETVLVGVSRNQDQRLSEQALGNLLASDSGGKHRDLYRESALRGSVTSIKALSYWADGSTESVLNQLLAPSRRESSSPLMRCDLRPRRPWQRPGL